MQSSLMYHVLYQWVRAADHQELNHPLQYSIEQFDCTKVIDCGVQGQYRSVLSTEYECHSDN